jgi:maltooligosyltrehalose trehalohydrolase
MDGGTTVNLDAEADGYFAGLVSDVGAGARYRFRVDGGDLFPDPASRFQPLGVHGPSEVVDARSFKWTDREWRGVSPVGQVLYELHVGTFTEKGTWASAIECLDHLKSVGITCIEMMPVNEFPGRWNWGYDGVCQFAPTANYGSPDDLRRFIDAAHARGIGVILDVVYNHFGPDGNYIGEYTDTFFNREKKNDWGAQINFDGEGSGGVRDFFIANARYWIEEFHFDGYRYDATQAILDESPTHILADIARAAREAGRGRAVYLVNENEPQHTRLVRPPSDGGIGMDALWNDDFHHAARVAMTGRRDAYFTDYKGTPQELLSAIKYGYLYQGQIYKWQSKRRGTPGLDLPPTAFVNYLQNHDQIANYAHGERLTRHTSLAELRAMTVLMLLAPQTPMLFMGQEWGATSRFLFFSDMCGELPKLVAEGRKREMSQFPSVGSPETLAALPEPCSEESFSQCKLRWQEVEHEHHQQLIRLHADLLRLRRTDAIFQRVQQRGDLDGAVLGSWTLAVRFFGTKNDDRLLLVNLDGDEYLDIVPEPLLAAPIGKRWETLLSSEQARYGGNGHVAPENHGEPWRLPGENWRVLSRCATVLRAVDEDESSRNATNG